MVKALGPSISEGYAARGRTRAGVTPMPRRTRTSSSPSPTRATILIALAESLAGSSGTCRMWAPPAAATRMLVTTRPGSTWTPRASVSAPMTCAAPASMPASSLKSEVSTACSAQTTALVTRLMRKSPGILGCKGLLVPHSIWANPQTLHQHRPR